MNKLCRKKLKPRQIFLFNDILVYGSIIIKKKKYARQHIIPLSNVKIEDYPEKEGKSVIGHYPLFHILILIYFII